MTNHTDCFHDSTSRARSTCRQVHTALALAESLGLEVTHSEVDTENIRQVSICEEGNPWYGTKLLLTWSSTGHLSIRRLAYTKTETVPRTHLDSWLRTLAVR